MKKLLFCLSLFLCTHYSPAQNSDPLSSSFIQSQHLSTQEQDALNFLYRNMPLSDRWDYSGKFWLDNVRKALQTKEDFSWGKQIPRKEWLHFVLPVRVNNEAVDSFRVVYYDELRQRVKNLSWRNAALEINHWCHEHMTYRPSDARTSSPLASVKNATGRCGEESTLAVAALRTVGIPARQVYTPRWAHTDDNHAWVEVYVDGKWQFIGACEPAPALNIAWFNAPVKRGMLMNTTVLGKYKGKEQILSETPTTTTINVTANYAPVIEQKVCIVDQKGNPIPQAQVRFGLYNYAEFYPIYFTLSDAKGRASLITGKGDLIIWASKDGKYGIHQISPSKKVHRIVLNHQIGDSLSLQFNIVPPIENHQLPIVSKIAEKINNERLAQEDAKRIAYINSWPSPQKVEEIAEVLRYEERPLKELFQKAEGNYMALYNFLEEADNDTPIHLGDTQFSKKEWALHLLSTLTDKDLRDFDDQVLTQHLNAFLHSSLPTALPLDTICQYILCPRINTEPLTAWRAILAQYPIQGNTAQDKVKTIIRFLTDSVQTDTTPQAKHIPLSPESILRYRIADPQSKGICFVAFCRSYGIPARYDEVTSQYQYYLHHQWYNVSFTTHQQDTLEPQHKLYLTYQPQPFMPDPAYYTHFTLSKLNPQGQPQLLNFPEGDTWDTSFAYGKSLTEGDYVLISGTRLANGTVLAQVDVFPLYKERHQPLILRKDTTQVAVIGGLNAESTYFDLQKQQSTSILSTTGRGYYILALLKNNDEPSTHILHDLENAANALNAWGRPILLLFPSKDEVKHFLEKQKTAFQHLPHNIHIGVDEKGNIANAISHSTLTCSNHLPMVLLADTFNRVVFFSQGYTIGIGNKLTQTLKRM